MASPVGTLLTEQVRSFGKGMFVDRGDVTNDTASEASGGLPSPMGSPRNPFTRSPLPQNPLSPIPHDNPLSPIPQSPRSFVPSARLSPALLDVAQRPPSAPGSYVTEDDRARASEVPESVVSSYSDDFRVYNDPDYIRRVHLSSQLNDLIHSGKMQRTQNFSENDPIDVLERAFTKFKIIDAHQYATNTSGHVMIAAMNIMEEASGSLGFDWLDLKGLGSAVASKRKDWMPALSEIVQRYQKRMTPGPEMRLFMSIAGIVFMVNVGNKSKALVGGGLPGKIIGNMLNPDKPPSTGYMRSARVRRPNEAELRRSRPVAPEGGVVGIMRRTKKASDVGMKGFPERVHSVSGSEKEVRAISRSRSRGSPLPPPAIEVDWSETMKRFREVESDPSSDLSSGEESEEGSSSELGTYPESLPDLEECSESLGGSKPEREEKESPEPFVEEIPRRSPRRDDLIRIASLVSPRPRVVSVNA